MCCFEWIARCFGQRTQAENLEEKLLEQEQKFLDRMEEMEQKLVAASGSGAAPKTAEGGKLAGKISWDLLRDVERGSENFVRAMSRDINYVPTRKASGTYIQWKQLVFSWAKRMRECGFSLETIGEKLFASAFVDGHEGEQRLIQNIGFNLISLMTTLETRMSPKIENIAAEFEKLLPIVVRPENMTPKTFVMLLGIAFDRESDMCKEDASERRSEKSKINNALRAMLLKDADTKMVRKFLQDLPTDSIFRGSRGEPLFGGVEEALSLLDINYEGRYVADEKDALYKGTPAAEKALQQLLTAVGERSSQHVDVHSARLNEHFIISGGTGGRAFLSFSGGKGDVGDGGKGDGGVKGGGHGDPNGGDKNSGKGRKKPCPYGSNCHNLSTTGRCRAGDHSTADWITNIRRFETNHPAEYAEWNRQRLANKAAREAEAAAKKGGGKK